MAVTLTHNLQTVVYVTDADARCGHAFAYIAPALHTSLFASLPTRVIQHNEGWSLTVQGRRDDGQPWHAPTATLNTPPSHRPLVPGDPQPRPAKRSRQQSPPRSSPRRSPRHHGRTAPSAPSSGTAVRGAMFPSARRHN